MTEKMVHCRYPKCSKLHESTELKKEDAVKAGGKNSYYHPDCFHMIQCIGEIKDTFIKQINPLMTKQQIGTLVSVINKIVYDKHVDIDYLNFCVKYFVKNKSGSLKQPFGLYYIIQNQDVKTAWEKIKAREIRDQIKNEIKNIDAKPKQDNEVVFVYKPQKPIGFADIIQ